MAQIVNVRNGNKLVSHLEVASHMKDRLVGLMGRKDFSEGSGLMIERSGNSIHTCFMRFAIDIAFVAKDGEVKYIVENMKPWRMTIAPTFSSTDALELPAGTLKKTETRIGDKLRVEA